MTTVRVRRKPLLPFFIALAGLPLIAIAFDFATGARLLRQIGDVVYASDVDPFELRDSFLASLFGFIGAGMVLWGLRELVFPQSVVRAEDGALRLAVRGPLGKLTNVPWDELEEVAATTRELDGHVVQALALTVTRPGELPDHPWNARWVGHTLVVDADHWDRPLEEVVNEIVRLRRAALTMAPPIPPAAPEPSVPFPEDSVATETAAAAPIAPVDVPTDPVPEEPVLEGPVPNDPMASKPPSSSPGDPVSAEGAPVPPEVVPTEPASEGTVPTEPVLEEPIVAEEQFTSESPPPDISTPDTKL